MALTKVGKEGITGISNSSDANAITIDSSENVGIGATNPNRGSHDRALLVSNTGSGARSAIEIEGNSSNANGTVTFLNNGTSAASIDNRGSGTLTFNTGSSLTERLRIQSGGGISFNGDTAAANALDDYEEGTFTVTVASGISVSSYDHQIGHYVKVGRMVTAWVFMEYNGSSRTSSHFIISGLPFTSSNDTSNEATMGGFITYQNSFSNAHNIIHVARNNTKAFFYELDGSDLIGSELSGASGEVRFVVQYTVA